MKKIWFAISGGVVIALIFLAVLALVRKPYKTLAQEGKELAVNLGCFACHGEGGHRGIPNVSSGEGDVPEWSGGTSMMYLESDKDIENYILKGYKGSEGSGSKGLMKMPAYENVISESELSKLMAYVKAVSNFYPEMPDKVKNGLSIAKKLGCFGCHGAMGMGGVGNRGSFKKVIPALYGKDFKELCRNEAELKNWILEGNISRLQNNFMAMYFLNRQKIKMPAFKGHITDGELSELVDFIQWLGSSEKAKNN